jgi:NADPH-dependent 2,4-dienoyl-CoA reductase/sulfur reductase-like enzyme
LCAVVVPLGLQHDRAGGVGVAEQGMAPCLYRLHLCGQYWGSLTSATRPPPRCGRRGAVAVIGAEPDPPYDRTQLSKQIRSGRWRVERATFRDPTWLNDLGARWLLGRPAVALDTAHRVVTLDGGERISYSDLVRRVATKAAFGIGVVRRRLALLATSNLVIVGGGFVGLEVDATARTRGLKVVAIEPQRLPLGSALERCMCFQDMSCHWGGGAKSAPGKVG